MRVLRVLVVLAGFLVLLRYVPVYYNTSEFNQFVKEETQRTRQRVLLKRHILNRARIYAFPITEEDIRIAAEGAVVRVAVNYRVPVDLFVFSHEMAFHAIGSGLLRE
jgi:hypothetical protein